MKTLKQTLRNNLYNQNMQGNSKHSVKVASGHKATEQVAGIYSIQTMKAYLQTINEFGDWLKEQGIKRPEDIDIAKSMIKDYLEYRDARGLSAWTINKDRAALNKCFNTNIEYKTCTKTINITRSRFSCEYEKHYNPQGKYKALFDFCKATGLRRHEVEQIKPSNLKERDGRFFVVVEQGKGGKYRESFILPQYQKEVLSLFRDRQGEEKLFDKVPRNIDIHSLRGQYAKGVYNHILENKEDKDFLRNDYDCKLKGTYYMRGDYKGNSFDKEYVEVVSKCLGHNRIDTSICSYLL